MLRSKWVDPGATPGGDNIISHFCGSRSRVPACSPVRLRACLHACLRACLHACRLVCLRACACATPTDGDSSQLSQRQKTTHTAASDTGPPRRDLRTPTCVRMLEGSRGLTCVHPLRERRTHTPGPQVTVVARSTRDSSGLYPVKLPSVA